MKIHPAVKSFSIKAALFGAALLLPTLGHAQTNEGYNGGAGVWDTDPANLDWNINGTPSPWTNGNNAFFNGNNPVTVSGTVDANYIEFDGGSTSVSGGTVDLFGTPSTYVTINDFSGTNAITSNIELADSGGDIQYFFNSYNGNNLSIGNVDFGPYDYSNGNQGRLQANAQSGSSETFTGTYTTSATHGGSINFGADTNVGTYTLAPTADFSNFNTGLGGGVEGNSFSFTGDVLNIETSKFDGNQTMSFYSQSAGNLVNIVGAQNIALNIYSSQKNSGPFVQDGPNDNPYGIGTTAIMTFVQSTADNSTWTGSVNQNGSSVVLGAVAGGRLTWNGNIGSSAPDGITIGASGSNETGTVVLGPNDYNETDGDGYLQPGSTTAADLRSGTTLINNGTDGSAFGTATTFGNAPIVQGTISSPEVVKVEAGATLGGNGSSAPQVVAMAGTSVITAGDPGQTIPGTGANAPTVIAPSIGILHLNGGLTTTNDMNGNGNGLTLDFKLTGDNVDPNTGPAPGISNDLIIVPNLTLNGTITVNLTALDALATGVVYTLMEGPGGDWQGNPNFVINAPAGYKLDPNFAGGAGYYFDTGDENFNTNANTLTVELELAPEPSTYGLMALGLLTLVAIGHFRRLNA